MDFDQVAVNGVNSNHYSIFYKCNKQIFDKYFWQLYNILNKRTVGQCTPDRRVKAITKNSALLYQSRGAIFYALN